MKKYANSLPDSILPPPSTSATSGAAPRMGTPQTDTSWAGWAISSFTNKIATASGDMQAKPGVSQTKSRPTDGRASSAPPVAPSSRPSQSSSSASTLHRKALAGSAAPALTRTSSDKPINNDQDDDNDEIDDAWGDIGGDSFFDAPSEISTTAPIAPFDDGGEPDFEGWLKAQAEAKSKFQLPKGLSKSSSTKASQLVSQTSQGRPIVAGSARSTPSLPTTSTTRAKQTSSTISSKGSVVAPKSVNTKPKDTGGEDDWGDAWD